MTSTRCSPLSMRTRKAPWTACATWRTSRWRTSRTGYVMTWMQCWAMDLPRDPDKANLCAPAPRQSRLCHTRPMRDSRRHGRLDQTGRAGSSGLGSQQSESPYMEGVISMSKEPSVIEKMLGDFAPKLVDLTDRVLFGDVWERPELSKRDRS